ncbi:related to RNA helicase, mitochondrial [Rhynchosporium agropyri]|uniref:RNA helicase n=1 Tax=Rhynchosporium agropyri TaxID=914238 RepID=A0A1E1LRQ7_9HELO|nr:related to RNA helicase, mitochondrial [Rhynchosporium agropyri]
MLRPKPSTCLLCSFRAARITSQSTRCHTQQTASLYQASKNARPNRMGLAKARLVGSGGSRTNEPGKPGRRRQDGPFGGMNLTKAGIRGQPERGPGSRSLDMTQAAKPAEAPRGPAGRGSKDRKDRGFKALKMQRTLAPVSYNTRTRIKARMAADADSFDHFGLLDSVKAAIPTQALQGMESLVPTPVQRIAIPRLLGDKAKKRKKDAVREEFLIAAETGSGKTLSYVLPMINAIKLAELEDAEFEAHEKALAEERARQNDLTLVSPPLSNMPHPTTGRPRAIILVPTSELVTQVGTLVKSLSHTIKFRSAVISSSFSGTVIRNRLFSPKGIDILISTPHLLSSIADSDPNILSRVSHLIIDEADSLMDRGFAPLTSAIIDRATPSLKQLILCSATIPRSLDSYLRKRFPDIQRLVTPNLHAIPRRVQLGVVDVERAPYQGNKNLACADSIWSIGKAAADHDGPVKGMIDVKRILVFVNEREKAQEVSDYLVSKGIDSIALSRDTPDHRQSEMLASFTSSETLNAPKADHPGALSDNQPNYVPFGEAAPPVKRKLNNAKVVVTTDLGSRGIDTLAVRHVILYDVPHSTIDFIHRLGRTGRMGRRGRGIVLVGKNDRRDVVAEVKDGMFKGQALI